MFRQLNKIDIARIVLLQLVVVVFFYFGYQQLSLRLDEAQSIWQTSHTIQELIASLSRNVHVPFFHVTFHYWQILTGNSLLMGRVYSLLFTLISIPVLYLTTKNIFDRKTAFLCSTLFSLSPFMHWYTSEIRMYTLLALLTITIHFLYLKLLSVPTKTLWLLYVLTAIIGTYTHYFFGLVLISQIVFFIFFTTKDQFDWKRIRGFLISGSITILAFLPWIYIVYTSERSLGSSPLLNAPTSIDFFNVFSHFLFGFQIDAINSLILSLWPASFILLLLNIQKNNKLSQETLFYIVAFITPLSTAFIISTFVTPVFLSRYLIIALPPFLIILSRLFIAIPQSAGVKMRYALITGMIIFIFIQLISPLTPTKERFSYVGTYLEERVSGRDKIIISAPFITYPIQHYYDGPARIETLPRWNRYNGEILPAFNEELLPLQVDDMTRHSDRLFIVLGYDQGYEDVIQSYLDKKFPLLDSFVVSKDLQLRVYKTRFYDPYADFRDSASLSPTSQSPNQQPAVTTTPPQQDLHYTTHPTLPEALPTNMHLRNLGPVVIEENFQAPYHLGYTIDYLVSDQLHSFLNQLQTFFHLEQVWK